MLRRSRYIYRDNENGTTVKVADKEAIEHNGNTRPLRIWSKLLDIKEIFMVLNIQRGRPIDAKFSNREKKQIYSIIDMERERMKHK